MTLEPAKDFRDSDLVRGWSDFMVSRQFSLAVQAAFYEMDRSLPTPTNNEIAAANSYRRDGAQRFLYLLMNLAERPKESAQKAAVGNLLHK